MCVWLCWLSPVPWALALPCPDGWPGTPKGAYWRPRARHGAIWEASGVSLGRPWATLGQPGAALGRPWGGLGRPEGNQVFRFEIRPDCEPPEVEISIILVFDGFLVPSWPAKAGQREAKGCQRRGQSLPWMPSSPPFTSFERWRTLQKYRQGHYIRKVGAPRLDVATP